MAVHRHRLLQAGTDPWLHVVGGQGPGDRTEAGHGHLEEVWVILLSGRERCVRERDVLERCVREREGEEREMSERERWGREREV